MSNVAVIVLPARFPSNGDEPCVVTSSDVSGWSVNWSWARPPLGRSADARDSVLSDPLMLPTFHSPPPAPTGPADHTRAASIVREARTRRRNALMSDTSRNTANPASCVEWRLRVENVRQVFHRGVSCPQRSEAKALLDGGQDRGRVVLGVVDDEVATQARGDDQARDPGAGSPHVVRSGGAALPWGCHVVPLAAELVVGHDDHGVLAARAAVDRVEQAHEVVAAAALAGIAGVLVLQPDRLDEADRVEVAGLVRRAGQAEKGL